MENVKVRGIGVLGENYSARYLESKGYEIVDRNVHVSKNEIDIIARKDGVLCFVEVKTRTFSAKYSSPLSSYRPADAVSFKKRINVVAAASGYLRENPTELSPRFDVIEIYFSAYSDGTYKFYKINHIENAFDAMGNII